MVTTISPTILEKIYQNKDSWAHKGQFGKLLVIAGSKRHTGSPIFASMAAYRSGCDLVYLVAPHRAADVAAHFSPNIITEPLDGDKFEPRHITRILKLIEETRITAMLIGPGLWRDRETVNAIIRLISETNLPLVIDADAIRAVAHKKEVLNGKSVILTPHTNEFLELTGIKVGKELTERVAAVEKGLKDLVTSTNNTNITILLK